MPFQPCPNIAEIRAHYLWAGQNVYNIYHAEVAGGWNPLLLNDLALDVMPRLEDILAIQPTTVQLVDVTCTDLSAEDGGQVTAIPAGTGLGLSTSPSLPNNCSVVIKWTTDTRGRSFRGRTYHVGLTEIMVTGNLLTATAHDDLLDLYTTLWGEIEEELPNRDFVVLSRIADGVPRVAGVGTQITHIVVEDVLDSQRRRLPGRGD